MSAQAQLYGVLDAAVNTLKWKQKHLKDIANYSTCFSSVEQCSQSKTYLDLFNAMANQKHCSFSEFTLRWNRQSFALSWIIS